MLNQKYLLIFFEKALAAKFSVLNKKNSGAGKK